MARYQTLSHRASGATSALANAPNGRVTAPGSKIVARGDRPHSPTAPAPAVHTRSRDTQSARQASAVADRASRPVRARGRLTRCSAAA